MNTQQLQNAVDSAKYVDSATLRACLRQRPTHPDVEAWRAALTIQAQMKASHKAHGKFIETQEQIAARLFPVA